MALVSATVLSVPQICESSLKIERRSANWAPSLWDSDFFKTLTKEYSVQEYLKRSDILKEKVRCSLVHLHEENATLAMLELIDDIQRLGLEYAFKEDIQRVLGTLFKGNNDKPNESLHATSLHFRLCRQHGFNVSQDVFKVYMNLEGGFMEQNVKDVLSLYEASYLGKQGEEILEEAKVFSKRILNDAKCGIIDSNLSGLVAHALEFPLYYNVTRLEERWYIDAYANNENPTLLELAKLEYNFIQAKFKEEIAGLSRWWEDLGLAKKLPFVRDRLAESFLWAMGTADQPQYKYCREGIAKITALITVIDDIYDIYATVDEAEKFTEAVKRWDITTVEQVPEYMKLPFYALYNTINDFAYNTLKEHGFDVLPHFRKQWENHINSYLLELKWFSTGYTPTLLEYLDNACVSASMPLVILHLYSIISSTIEYDSLDYIESFPCLSRSAAIVLRLADDLGTSKHEIKRCDVPKAIQCHMKEIGVTEEVAQIYIKKLSNETWKKMLTEMNVDSPIHQCLQSLILNGVRTGEMFNGNGVVHGMPDKKSKELIISLLVDTIPMF